MERTHTEAESMRDDEGGPRTEAQKKDLERNKKPFKVVTVLLHFDLESKGYCTDAFGQHTHTHPHTHIYILKTDHVSLDQT